MSKQCTKCNQHKPHSEFHKSSGRKDGLSSWCKTCACEQKRQYYQDNKETVKARTAAYRKTPKGKEVQRRSHRKYYKNNREVALQYGREYRRSERGRAVKAAYCERNSAKIKAKRALNNAVKRGDFPKLKDQFIPCEIQGPRCTERAQERHHHLGYEPKHWFDFQYVCRMCHKSLP